MHRLLSLLALAGLLFLAVPAVHAQDAGDKLSLDSLSARPSGGSYSDDAPRRSRGYGHASRRYARHGYARRGRHAYARHAYARHSYARHGYAHHRGVRHAAVRHGYTRHHAVRHTVRYRGHAAPHHTYRRHR